MQSCFIPFENEHKHGDSMAKSMEVYDKIRVFISSQCGNKRYDHVRKELKKLIEETGLAKVYLFEDRLASTQTASQHYLYALDDSDVCIFLIDNADGVPSGVMREINRAKSHPKKSLYLFCEERQKEPTQVQRELMGAQGVKCHEVETFDELGSKAYRSLINDITCIYSNYCKNRLIDAESARNQELKIEVDAVASEALEKRLLKGIDKTKLYLGRQVFSKLDREVKETSELDFYCEAFLRVLFGEKSIRDFNTSLLLLVLEELQSEKLHEVVVNRWKAIQFYWNDDIEKSIACKETALKIAEANSLPDWIVQDILIDLRNLYMIQGEKNNQIVFNSKAQQELDGKTTALFYPLIDRYDGLLYEEITQQVMKASTKSPYTISWGHNIHKYTDYLANVYVISVFNGSLTHILMVIDRLKNIAFNLCKEHGNWLFRVLLLKLSISRGERKETERYIDLFNDVFGKMNASDSVEIYDFCNSIPIKYQRDTAKLKAFGCLGYFFSDEDYENISMEMISLIEDWITQDEPIIMLGEHVFEALKQNHLRMDRNTIIRICLRVIDKKWYRFSDKVLDLIARLGIDDIEDNLAEQTVDAINGIIIDETLRKTCYKLSHAIISVRKSRKDYTDELHKNVSELMPKFYQGLYRLETTVDSLEDSEEYIYKYVSEIRERNQTQGKDGKYSGYAYSPLKTIKNIVAIHKLCIDEKLLNVILEVAKETLLCPKQLLSEKIEAIKLIIFMKLNSRSVMYDYAEFFQCIESNKEVVMNGFSDLCWKETNATIQFNYMMMKMAFDNLDYGELLECLGAYGEIDEFEKIEALKALVSVFENDYCSDMDRSILFVILQFVLGLSHDANHDVRYYAVKTLLLMITPDTKDPILTRLSKMMDYDSFYVKSLILNQAEELMSISPEMVDFIIQKATVDNHYVIRTRGRELAEKNRLES